MPNNSKKERKEGRKKDTWWAAFFMGKVEYYQYKQAPQSWMHTWQKRTFVCKHFQSLPKCYFLDFFFFFQTYAKFHALEPAAYLRECLCEFFVWKMNYSEVFWEVLKFWITCGIPKSVWERAKHRVSSKSHRNIKIFCKCFESVKGCNAPDMRYDEKDCAQRWN